MYLGAGLPRYVMGVGIFRQTPQKADPLSDADTPLRRQTASDADPRLSEG